MATVSIDVYIKLPSGKAFSSQHLPSDTVRKIAEFVGKKEGVPEKRVRIKYQGKTLDKSKTVGYLGICAETILKAEVSLNALSYYSCFGYLPCMIKGCTI